MFGFIPLGKEARMSQEDQTLKFTGDLDLLLILGLTAAEKAEISTEPSLPQGLNHGGHALLGLLDAHR